MISNWLYKNNIVMSSMNKQRKKEKKVAKKNARRKTFLRKRQAERIERQRKVTERNMEYRIAHKEQAATNAKIRKWQNENKQASSPTTFPNT